MARKESRVARKNKNNRRKHQAMGAGMQRLEERQLMAADISLGADGVLDITGSDQADEIVVEQSMRTYSIGSPFGMTRTYTVEVVDVKVLDSSGGRVAAGSYLKNSVKALNIDAGNGNDKVRNNTTLNATIRGGAGNDHLYGGDAVDKIYGDAGVDVLRGGAGADYLYGGADRDYLYGGDGGDKMFGEAGDDYLVGEYGDDTIHGGSGNDRIYGSSGDDTIYGGAGDDTISGSYGDDTIYGDDGEDTIYGGTGADELHGGLKDDYIRGGSGNDKVYGDNGEDQLYGDDGDDEVSGGLGEDYISGGYGKDVLLGRDLAFEQDDEWVDEYNTFHDVFDPNAWDSDGIDFTEIDQRDASTCSVLSTLAAVANSPHGQDLKDRVRYLGNDLYEVRLYGGASEKLVTVHFDGTWSSNDASPTRERDETGRPSGAMTGEFWALLFQRAFLGEVPTGLDYADPATLGSAVERAFGLASASWANKSLAMKAFSGFERDLHSPYEVSPEQLAGYLANGDVLTALAGGGHRFAILDVFYQDGGWKVKVYNPRALDYIQGGIGFIYDSNSTDPGVAGDNGVMVIDHSDFVSAFGGLSNPMRAAIFPKTICRGMASQPL